MFRAFRIWTAPDRAADGAARALATLTNVRERIVSPENFIEHETDNNEGENDISLILTAPLIVNSLVAANFICIRKCTQ